MNYSKGNPLLKHSFRNLNFYSIPLSILFIVRKRLNLIFFLASIILVLFWTL